MSTYRPTFNDLWLTESIKTIESKGWLDDVAVLRKLAGVAANQSLRPSELIQKRSEFLAQAHALVTSMPSDIKGVKAVAKLVSMTFFAIALFIGLNSAPAFLGGGRVNIMVAWFALLGPHLLSLVFWLTGMLLGLPAGSLSFGNLWRYAVERFASKHRAVLLTDALADLLPTRLLKWSLSAYSHMLWCVYFVGALLGLLGLMAFREYSFAWETTILSTSFFVGFVDVIGWLPAKIGLQIPDGDVVANLPVTADARKAWSWWLLGSLLVYGLGLRFALLAFSWFKWKKGCKSLSLDLADPYYSQLLERIRTAIRPKTAIVDPAPPAQWQTPATPLSDDKLPIQKLRIECMLVGFELDSNYPWPPDGVTAEMLVLPNVLQQADHEIVLDELARARPSKVVVAVESGVTADRGAFSFLSEVQKVAGDLRVVLLHQEKARQSKVFNWVEGLKEIRIEGECVFADLSAAIQWLSSTES